MATLKHGIIIAVEGADGSGKSTLARNLAAALQQMDFDVLLTKESGATPLGKLLHKIVQAQQVSVCDKAEYLLFAADRAQHMSELIEPALAQNNIVISDRMGDSSVVYQGYGRGLDVDMIKKINFWAQNDRTPDLTIFVEIDLATARARLTKRGKEEIESVFEAKQQFMQRVIDGYRTLMHNRPHVITLDGTQTEEKLARDGLNKVLQWIETNNLRLHN